MSTSGPELAERYGTPQYLYRLERVRESFRELCGFLPRPSTVHYSLKANPHPDVVRTVIDMGAAVEVCSTGELTQALLAGAVADEVLYGGPGKTRGEVRDAVRLGVRKFSVESLADLRKVDHVAAEVGVRLECLVRVNTEHGVVGGLRMAGKPSQFGIDEARVALLAEQLRATRAAEVVGLHFFSISSAADEETLVGALVAGVTAARRLHVEHGIPLHYLDLGGGFAAPHARPGGLPEYLSLAGALTEALDSALPGWRAGSPVVAFESGRYIAATSGTLLASVTDVKRSGDRVFVVVESGINHLGGLAGLGRLLPTPVRGLLHGAAADAPVEDVEVADVVGPLCTPVDVHSRNAPVGAVAVGDLFEVPNVGAYGLTASLTAFLSRPAPVEVVVDGEEVVSATRLVQDRIPVPNREDSAASATGAR